MVASPMACPRWKVWTMARVPGVVRSGTHIGALGRIRSGARNDCAPDRKLARLRRQLFLEEHSHATLASTRLTGGSWLRVWGRCCRGTCRVSWRWFGPRRRRGRSVRGRASRARIVLSSASSDRPPRAARRLIASKTAPRSRFRTTTCAVFAGLVFERPAFRSARGKTTGSMRAERMAVNPARIRTAPGSVRSFPRQGRCARAIAGRAVPITRSMAAGRSVQLSSGWVARQAALVSRKPLTNSLFVCRSRVFTRLSPGAHRVWEDTQRGETEPTWRTKRPSDLAHL